MRCESLEPNVVHKFSQSPNFPVRCFAHFIPYKLINCFTFHSWSIMPCFIVSLDYDNVSLALPFEMASLNFIFSHNNSCSLMSYKRFGLQCKQSTSVDLIKSPVLSSRLQEIPEESQNVESITAKMRTLVRIHWWKGSYTIVYTWCIRTF